MEQREARAGCPEYVCWGRGNTVSGCQVRTQKREQSHTATVPADQRGLFQLPGGDGSGKPALWAESGLSAMRCEV